MIYLELFITFLKIGALTFGGGHAMIPFIQEQVMAHNWLSYEQLINFIAISETTPGTFAVNISTYVGMKIGGILGAICTTMGAILPSFIIMIIIVNCYEKFQNSKLIKACMSGIRPAVIGLIATIVVSIGKSVFFPIGGFSLYAFISSLIIFCIMLILAMKKVNPIVIIIASSILGIVVGYGNEIIVNLY